MPTKRSVQFVSTLLCMAMALHARGGSDDAVSPAINPNVKNYEEKAQGLVEEARKINPKVLFIGDSLTELWTNPKRGLPVWEKHFAALKSANIGLSGDRTQNVLWRLQKADWKGIDPKVVVLMIGVNNGDDGEALFAGQEKVVEEIGRLFPKAQIIFIPVLPRKKDAQVLTTCAANEMAPRLGKNMRKRLTVLDIGEKFLRKNGSLDDELFYDGLHLTTAGFEVWAKELSPVVSKLLKSNAGTMVKQAE